MALLVVLSAICFTYLRMLCSVAVRHSRLSFSLLIVVLPSAPTYCVFYSPCSIAITIYMEKRRFRRISQLIREGRESSIYGAAWQLARNLNKPSQLRLLLANIRLIARATIFHEHSMQRSNARCLAEELLFTNSVQFYQHIAHLLWLAFE